MELEDKLYVLTTDIKDIEKGTSAYFSVEYQISVLKEEIHTLETTKANKLKQVNNYTSTIRSISDNQNEIIDMIDKVTETLNCNEEFNKTNPLFIYYDYKADDIYSGATVVSSASEAYAKYKVNDLKTYITDNKPYEFLTEKDKVACCTKNKNGNVTYWVVKCVESSDIFFIPFNNKKEFTKSNFDIGCKNNNKEYYVKFGGQTFEFTETKDKKTGETKTAKENAVIFIEKNNILKDFITKQSFEESGKLMGQNSESHKYYYYDFEETDENGVLSKIKTILDKESGNDDDYIVKKYYENHKYGYLSDFGYEKNYGVIQFYYTGKIHPTGENYETIQDFIARHKIVSGETKYNTNISSSATTKYVTTQ